MKATRRSLVWTMAWMAAAVLTGAMMGPAAMAQDAASSLDSSEAAEYIGVWDVSMEFGDLTLTFKDVDGKLSATLESDQQPAPQVIDTISKSDEGLKLEFESDFGLLTILLNIEGGALVGTLGSADGAFSVELTGTKGEFEETEELNEGELTEEQRRALARRRRGPAVSKADFNGKNVQLTIGTVPVDGPDFAELGGVALDSVARFTVSSAIKLMTDTDLVFGDEVVETHNFGETYPGVYSVWLKKVAKGWHVVFNAKPDVWGTQHDPAADVVEVPISHETVSEPTEKLECTITNEGGTGVLRIAWGPNVWAAQFKTID